MCPPECGCRRCRAVLLATGNRQPEHDMTTVSHSGLNRFKSPGPSALIALSSSCRHRAQHVQRLTSWHWAPRGHHRSPTDSERSAPARPCVHAYPPASTQRGFPTACLPPPPPPTSCHPPGPASAPTSSVPVSIKLVSQPGRQTLALTFLLGFGPTGIPSCPRCRALRAESRQTRPETAASQLAACHPQQGLIWPAMRR